MGKLCHAAAATILALILASAAADVRAQDTGVDLLKQCKGKHKAYCAGYIAGLYDGVATDHLLDENLDICLPARRGTVRSSISYEQMVQIYVEWASANRDRIRNTNRFVAVRRALSESFPCPESDALTSPNDPKSDVKVEPAARPSTPSQANETGESSE